MDRIEDEDGNLKDYDPTLVKVDGGKSESGKDLKEYQYTNKEGDKKHYLPKDLTQDTPILMENGNYVISFAPIYGEKKEDQTSDDQNAGESRQEEQSQAGAAVKKAAVQSQDIQKAEETASDKTAAAIEEAVAGENAFADIQELTRGEV